MKKLLVKIKVIDIPYSPLIPAIPEKWVKDEVEVFEQPMIEVDGSLVADESYTYHPAIPEIPEQPEVSHEEIIAQTQGTDDELAVWLAGDAFKYPMGYWVEYFDLTEEFEKKKAIDAKVELGRRARSACEAVLDLISGYNLNRQLTLEQITQMQTNFSNIEKALQSARPSLAKMMIKQIEADGVLITQEMKDMVLELLSEF